VDLCLPLQLRSTNKTRQLELLETVFRDTHSLEQLFYEKYVDEPQNKKKYWRQLFFQQLEWFAYLVNHKKIKDNEFIEFFKKPFVDWCEKIFARYAEPDQITESDRFEELKLLYTITKKQLQISRST